MQTLWYFNSAHITLLYSACEYTNLINSESKSNNLIYSALEYKFNMLSGSQKVFVFLYLSDKLGV